MIVLVIFISGLLVSSANYLSFLNPNGYSTLRHSDDSTAHVSLPSPLLFGSSCYNDAYVNTKLFCMGIN